MRKILYTIMASAMAIASSAALSAREPDGSFLYAHKDSCDLFFDFYRASGDSAKATVIYAFGGGFKEGSRDQKYFTPWFDELNANGYNVVSIDYRLGLKDVKGAGVNMKFAESLEGAIRLAVEDLFSATAYLLENAEGLGIDTSRLVISGSSAGAITVLQAEWEICNRHKIAEMLPAGFNYAGVMAFSGAIFSREGAVRYASEPCPTALFHGTADKIVPYGQFALFKMRFAGSNVLAKTMLGSGYSCNVFRFKDRGHEIASSMMPNLEEELLFLDRNVCRGERRIVDATIDDPSIPRPSWGSGDYKGLY